MLFKEVHILRKHGFQAIRDLRAVKLPETFRGRPVISAELSEAEALQVSGLCPASAITEAPFSLDLGRCLFCGECQHALPGKICFTPDPEMATNVREKLRVAKGSVDPIIPDPEKARPVIRKVFRRALKLRQVSAGGDNSAEMELNAAGNVNFDMGRFGIEFVASPRHADGLVITGPVTENMVDALEICYEAVPDPKVIILCGTDAISGGMFRRSDAIDRRFTDFYPVDLFIPGNPPHPLTFILGLLRLTGRL